MMVERDNYLEVRKAFKRAGRGKGSAGTRAGSEEYDGVLRLDSVFRGINVFKRRVLGFCGEERTMDLEELEGVLLDIGAVDSIERAINLIPKMYGQTVYYTASNGISFTEIRGPGNVSCRVMHVCYRESTYRIKA